MNLNGIELKQGDYVFPGVKVIENVIDYSKELIEIANSIPDNWSTSALGGERSSDTSVRRSSTFPLPVHFNNPTVFFELAQTVYLYAQQYAEENGIYFSHMETLSMLEYLAGDGFYHPHHDFGPETPRTISAILYLNDVEEGGETYFDQIDLTVVPQEGRLVLFPSTFPYSHEARNPLSGNKYVVVTWFGQPVDSEALSRYYRGSA